MSSNQRVTYQPTAVPCVFFDGDSMESTAEIATHAQRRLPPEWTSLAFSRACGLQLVVLTILPLYGSLLGCSGSPVGEPHSTFIFPPETFVDSRAIHSYSRRRKSIGEDDPRYIYTRRFKTQQSSRLVRFSPRIKVTHHMTFYLIFYRRQDG